MTTNHSHNSFFSMIKNNGEECSPEKEDLEPPIEGAKEYESCESEDSEMPHEAKRVLVHLMRQGVIISAQHQKLFELVCRYETYVRRHLSEVFLQLILDRKSGIAFVASLENEFASDDSDDESTSLISKRTLPLYDTLILLVLRKHYQERESTGEQKITIDIERLESYLTPFVPLTDHSSLDRKKLVARVKEMVRRKILSTIRGSEDRYEITPIIRYVVNAEFLESMLAEYTNLASNADNAACLKDEEML